MATSGSANFSTTRNELIETALLNVSGIGIGETPSATQYTNTAYLLNLLVKSWAADGMPLWAIKQFNFSLTATTSYTIGTSQTVNTYRPVRLHSAFIRDNTDSDLPVDVPLQIYTRQEYDDISSKQSTGSPTVLYYDPQGGATATGTIHIWPKPDANAIANKVIYIRYQRPYEDFDASSDEPDFPQEWFLPVLWYLSWMLAPSYGVPLQERTVWLREAERLKEFALAGGAEEGSIYFGVSTKYGRE
jgi:hypothetical protein